MKASAMNRSTTLKIALLGTAATALQGCVAAVVPLAAGGLLGGAAPNYRPSDAPEPSPAIAEGTVEVERSQAALQPPPQAVAVETVPPSTAEEALTSEPGLAEDAIAEVTSETNLAVPDIVEEEAEAIAAAPTVETPVSASEPEATFAAEDVEALEEGLGVVESDDLAAPATSQAPITDIVDEPEAALAAAAPESIELSTNEALIEAAAEVAAVVPPADEVAVPAALAIAEVAPEVSAETPDLGDAPDAEPDTAPVTVAELAVAPEPEAPAPAAVEVDPAPVQPAAEPVRVFAVDSQSAFSDSAIDASSLSAADAAAALASLPAAEEPAVNTAQLARSAPLEAPASASPATTVETPSTELAAVQPEVATPAIAPGSASEPLVEAVAEVAPAPAAPVAVEPQPGPVVRTLAAGPFASLINYANGQQATSAEDRSSALLADRASLRPTRAACGGSDPTVLIDLDPDGETFDPTNASLATQGLASALAQVRANGVKVAWISSNSVSQIRNIRAALARSGLDLADKDEVLLMRYPEDRKQTRREDLAANACLVAIAGDVRTDFDELFEYLINPEAAATLNPLMDNGWFLIPTPFRDESVEEAAEEQENPTR